MSERYRILRTTNRFFTIELLLDGAWHVLPPLQSGYFFADLETAQVWLLHWLRHRGLS